MGDGRLPDRLIEPDPPKLRWWRWPPALTWCDGDGIGDTVGDPMGEGNRPKGRVQTLPLPPPPPSVDGGEEAMWLPRMFARSNALGMDRCGTWRAPGDGGPSGCCAVAAPRLYLFA